MVFPHSPEESELFSIHQIVYPKLDLIELAILVCKEFPLKMSMRWFQNYVDKFNEQCLVILCYVECVIDSYLMNKI